MLATLVLFDPESALPTGLVAEASTSYVVIRVERADEARRFARHATVVVIVANGDVSTMLGFLASLVQQRDARLVVFAEKPVRQHQVILHALRRGAIVLIKQSPSVLVECVADLIASMQSPREAA